MSLLVKLELSKKHIYSKEFSLKIIINRMVGHTQIDFWFNCNNLFLNSLTKPFIIQI